MVTVVVRHNSKWVVMYTTTRLLLAWAASLLVYYLLLLLGHLLLLLGHLLLLLGHTARELLAARQQVRQGQTTASCPSSVGSQQQAASSQTGGGVATATRQGQQHANTHRTSAASRQPRELGLAHVVEHACPPGPDVPPCVVPDAARGAAKPSMQQRQANE